MFPTVQGLQKVRAISLTKRECCARNACPNVARVLCATCISSKERVTSPQSSLKLGRKSPVGLSVYVFGFVVMVLCPTMAPATHEADHRFMVEGYVCGKDGKGISGTDVLVKDTKISYGQVVKTDGDGYYKAMFHLHNDNLGDPLLVEASAEQKNLKIEFDPKDLESERKIRVDFGSGCGATGSSTWIWWAGGAVAAAGGVIGMKLVRSQPKQGRSKKKSQGKKNT